MKRSRVLVMATALASMTGVPVGSPGSPQAVAGGGGTRCHYVQEVDMEPGLSVQGSSGSFASTDPRGGTITDCDGPFLGIEPTGPGRFYVRGRYGTEDPDTCHGGGEGAGDLTFTFPTATGDKSVYSVYTITYGGLSTKPGDGLVALEVVSDDFIVEGSITPIEGDCITRPVTRVRDKGVFTTRR